MDSLEATKTRRDKEEVAAIIVDCAFHLHRDLGPGLLETVYEVVLAKLLHDRGLAVERQKPIPIQNLPLGLLINFGAATFKEGCKRIVNGPQSFACLCVNRNP